MEAFVDESGTHRGAPKVAVAATVGAHWQWRRFLSRWGDREFHAKERKHDALKLSLFQAIEDCRIESFVSWLIPDHYELCATEHFRTGLGNAYSVCAFASAIGVCKHCKTNNLGKVAFVIEDGQPNVKFVQSVLEYMKAKERYGIASVAVASKRDFVQLCTADFLAHSRTSGPEWFEPLESTGLVSQCQITTDRIARMAKQISDGLRGMKQQRRLLKTRNIADGTIPSNDANEKGKTSGGNA